MSTKAHRKMQLRRTVEDEMAANRRFFRCADAFRVVWTGSDGEERSDEAAILHDISRGGGHLHIEDQGDLRVGSMFRMQLPQSEVPARVLTLSRDKYGYAYVSIRVYKTSDWFGGKYRPQILDSDSFSPFALAS